VKLRRILRKREVLAASGYRQTQLDELIDQGKFPAPIHLSEGGRALGWFEDEIIAHQEARAAERDRGRDSHKIKEQCRAVGAKVTEPHSPHQGRRPRTKGV
jgi:prophage regulatory protein